MAEHTRASVDAVRSAATGWDDDQLECRMYGHIWRPSSARHDKRSHLIKVVQLCPRCHSERHQEIHDRNGEVFAQWIVYADGYLMKGIGRISGDGRDALRLETIERTFKITRGKISNPHKAAREALHINATVSPIRKAS